MSVPSRATRVQPGAAPRAASLRALATAKRQVATALRAQAAAVDLEADALEQQATFTELGPRNDDGPTDRLLTLEEGAEKLAIQPDTLRKWASAGRVASIKTGRGVRFRVEDLEAYIADRRRPTVLEVARTARGRGQRQGHADAT